MSVWPALVMSIPQEEELLKGAPDRARLSSSARALWHVPPSLPAFCVLWVIIRCRGAGLGCWCGVIPVKHGGTPSMAGILPNHGLGDGAQFSRGL